ncbi:hypothetical protein NPS01_31370 [Nocardioides psychrotolerans]|nr:hypothetical protein NPS01_31370 [Nocardioides psychrotolerans]
MGSATGPEAAESVMGAMLLTSGLLTYWLGHWSSKVAPVTATGTRVQEERWVRNG